jgi:RNA polymerase sigma-70 factor (ECF subfamily)
MKDEEIIDLYWRREESAIQETHAKYGSYCYTIANRILYNHQDSEECVNDTWLRTWNALPPERPGFLRSYLAKITRNLSLDRYRSNTSQKRGGGEFRLALDELAECVADTKDLEDELMAQELNTIIQSFVKSLPPRDGDVFLRRYFYFDSTGDIARRYGLKESNVLMILSRTRSKLKDRLTKEGYLL